MLIRKSEQQSRVTRSYTFRCSNDECGYSATGMLELIHTLSPPAVPAAGVSIPLSPKIEQRMLLAKEGTSS